MLEKLTAEQWDDWLSYAEANPFGETRADLRFAALAITVLSALAGDTTNAPSLFYPYFQTEENAEAEEAAAEAAIRDHCARYGLASPIGPADGKDEHP